MIVEICEKAKKAKTEMLKLTTVQKNRILLEVANEIEKRKTDIISANLIDIKMGKKAGLSEALIDRLTLNDDRILSIKEALETIVKIKDPIGVIKDGYKVKSGILIEKVQVPLGVVGIIYEARPNVTVDAAALCLKASNVSILRGSSYAINTNKILAKIFIETGVKYGLPENAINLIEDTSKEGLKELINQEKYIDVLIPRGGKELKKFILMNGTIPMIITGAGTCHLYVDEYADIEKAMPIMINAKTQRPSTCNSLECLILHKNIVPKYINKIVHELIENEVKVNIENINYLENDLKCKITKVDKEYYGYEFLSKEIFIKEVENIDEAIDYINEYGTSHSDSIITENISNAEKFLNLVDSSCVYLNASTRFSDGGEFGFGGEIGISTQKLHARGPMGVTELTSSKYIIRGNGEIRK